MATKKFVPRGNNEGFIGDEPRRWKEIHAATGSFYNGLSGSLQTLTNGLSYLVEGSNISIVTESNGQITIAASGFGTMSSFDASGDSGLSPIQNGEDLSILGGSNITTTMNSRNLTVDLDSQVSITGLTASNGIELTNSVPVDTTNKLYNNGGTISWNGSPIGAGTMSSFGVTGSHDTSTPITISDSNVLFISGSGAISIKTGATNTVSASLLLNGPTLQQDIGGLKVNPNLTVDSLTTTGDLDVQGNLRLTGDLRVDGTTTTIDTENLLVKDRFILLASGSVITPDEPPVQGGIIVASGALGTNQSLFFGTSGSMWHAVQGDAKNGIVNYLPDGDGDDNTGGSPTPYVPLAASEFRLSGSDVRRLTTDGSNIILTSDNMLQFTGSADFKDPSIFNQGLTGSLTRIKKSDGSLIKYIEGNDKVKVTTGSFGEIQLDLHPGAGGSFSSFDFGIRDVDEATVGDGDAVYITSSNGISLERNNLSLTASLNVDSNFQFDSNQLQLADSVFIVSDLTASNSVSSSLYTFENKASSQTFEDGQLINITGSLFWKNPNDIDALRILSGSVESGGVSFTAGDGLHLNSSDILSASLVEESEGGNLRFVNAKLDLSESISLTNISASNAVSSSYFVLGDGFTSDPESGKNTLWINTADSNKLYLRGALLAAGSVAADDVTPGDDPARFETTNGDIGISGSNNIGLTGSIISLHEHNTKRGEIDLSSSTLEFKSSNAMDFKFNSTFNLEHSFLKAAPGFDTLILSASSNALTQGGALVLGTSYEAAVPSSNPSIKLEVNDSTKSRIEFDAVNTDDVIFNYGSSDEVYRYNSDAIKFSKIVTASNGVSSSLYTFENQATSQTFENGQLINITGSLFWKNPNDSAELKLLSGSEGGSTLTGGSNITIANDSVDLDNTVGITHLTASSQVSSSLYFFENHESGLPPTSENSSLFNATGSLFWRNPVDGSEARILSGSAGVSFTTGDGIHLDETTNILSASLVENGNLEIVNSRLDLSESISITNLTASNAVSSSLYTFKDVGDGTTSNYSNQLYNVTGTLYWNTNDALLSGTLDELKTNLLPSINSVTVDANPNSLSSTSTGNVYMLTVSVDDQDLTLESYASLDTGYKYILKNKSSTNSVNIVPTHGEFIDGTQNASASLQPLSSYTFIYSNDAAWGWIIT